MRRWLILLAAASLLAAGCLSGGDDPAQSPAEPNAEASDGNLTTSAQSNASADLARVEAPDWEVGQWFTYERQGAWTMGTDGQVELVVLEADGSSYRTGLSEREASAVDLFWFNHPLLGPLDADLAPQLPAEGNPPSRILDWPLEDGKTWETDGYGDTWTVEAHRVEEIDTPEGAYPGYAITANGTLADAIEATYVPQLEALTRFAIHWTSEGDPAYQLDLVDAGTDHGGPAWTGEPLSVLHDTWTAEELVPPQQDVDVPEAATDLYTLPLLRAPSGAAVASLSDPGNEERYRTMATPGSRAGELVAFEDPASGSWTWNLETTGTQQCGEAPAGAGCAEIFLRSVVLEIEQAG